MRNTNRKEHFEMRKKERKKERKGWGERQLHFTSIQFMLVHILCHVLKKQNVLRATKQAYHLPFNDLGLACLRRDIL